MQTAQLDCDLIRPSKEARSAALVELPPAAPALLKKPKKRIVFMYLGRRGGIARLAYELGRAAIEHPRIDPLLVLSDSNELLGLTRTLSDVLRTVRVFSSGIGALTQAY